MYIGKFRNLNELEYIVEIHNAANTGVTELKLGTPAFTVSYEGDEENICKPVKYSSATFKVVSNDYLFDLYQADAHSNKVILKEGSNVKWVGYVTPNLYSQPYENDTEAFDIECIDGLSTLQYFKYEQINKEKKQVPTFVQIINNILSKCGVYSKFHISNSIKVSKTDAYCMAHYCSVSESNFYDGEDQEPMTMQDVLEEVCKFMNLTAIAEGDEVYFVSYNEIKNGAQEYTTYVINGDLTAPTISGINLPVVIKNSVYRSNGSNLSLGMVYNKVSVVAKHNAADDLLPDLDEEKYLHQRLLPSELMKLESYNVKVEGGQKNVQYQWFDHEVYTEYFYDYKNNTYLPVEKSVPFSVQDIVDTIGGCMFKTKVSDTDKPKYPEKESQLSLSTYLLLAMHCFDGDILPLFSMKNNDAFNVVATDDSKIVLSGSVKYYSQEKDTRYPVDFSAKKNMYVENCKDNLILPLIIRLGDKYFNTSTMSWQKEKCYAKIPLYTDAIDEKDKLDNVSGTELRIKNTIDWTEGYESADGYAIPMPSPLTNLSDLEITFVNLQWTLTHITGRNIEYAFIKDFKAKVARPTPVDKSGNIFSPDYDEKNKQENNDTDTIYENVINTDYVEEMSEIEFAINTDNGKANSYSSVLYDKGNGLMLLDKTFDTSTNQELRQEEQLIYRLVKQYEQPAIIIDSTLNTDITPLSTCNDVALPGRTFIVNSTEINYEYDSQEINLIEKK